MVCIHEDDNNIQKEMYHHHFLFLTHKYMPVISSLECRTFHEILLFMFIETQLLFVCIIWQSCHISALWNTMNMLFVCDMDVSYEHYNVKHCGKHEMLLLDTCLLYLYFPPDWVGKYLGTYNNNITHIYRAIVHDV